MKQRLDAGKEHGVSLTNENQTTSPKRVSPKSSTYSTKRDEMTERQQREANLGTILVCISLLFILCQSIKIIPDVSTIQYTKLKKLRQ